MQNDTAVTLQNVTGATLRRFLTLLEFYLKATFISYEDETYLQKQGICIGCCVAPVLCNVLLSDVDRALHNVLGTDVVAKVFRYGDDFLVLLRKRPGFTNDETIGGVLKAFEAHGEGLKFTHELSINDEMQFLHIAITFLDSDECRSYHPRSKKELLP